MANYYQSKDEALGWTIGFMHEHQSWGLYTGWASSYQDILRSNQGRITPGVVEGFFRQYWRGEYNISADYSPISGFNVASTLALDINVGDVTITYVNYLKMVSLLDGGVGGMEFNPTFSTIALISSATSVVPVTIGASTNYISKTANYTDDIAKIGNIATKTSNGLSLVSITATYGNYKLGNVSGERYYVQQAINIIGLFGIWGAGISIGLSIIDAAYGDDIEKWIREW